MKSKTYKNRTKKPMGLIYDHMIFHTKYNRKVLVDKIRRRCELIIRNVLDDIGCESVEINVQPNHVHILVGIPLTITPSHVAMKVKGNSSWLLRNEFPILKQQIPKALWAPSCTHQSVGNDLTKVIYYIRNQYKKHGGPK
jgi:putative transposase